MRLDNGQSASAAHRHRRRGVALGTAAPVMLPVTNDQLADKGFVSAPAVGYEFFLNPFMGVGGNLDFGYHYFLGGEAVNRRRTTRRAIHGRLATFTFHLGYLRARRRAASRPAAASRLEERSAADQLVGACRGWLPSGDDDADGGQRVGGVLLLDRRPAAGSSSSCDRSTRRSVKRRIASATSGREKTFTSNSLQGRHQLAAKSTSSGRPAARASASAAASSRQPARARSRPWA